MLTCMHSGLFITGTFILIISSLTGLFGVIMAIVQHDLKKLLACSSIENIGIIGMGIGTGAIGTSINNPGMAILGYAGALLHVLNHSLFKSLLFFSAGSVYSKYKTRNINQLGGVIHKMPKTAFMFLIGSIAICGLPPLNGFISELLIYCGMFKGFANGYIYQSIIMLLSVIALVAIGGLAIFCFSKAFGIVFLGSSRDNYIDNISEVNTDILVTQAGISILILAIGMIPLIFLRPVLSLVSELFMPAVNYDWGQLFVNLNKITLFECTLISVILLLSIIRYAMMRKKTVRYGTTWGCGYSAITEKQQYTGTSFATGFSDLAEPVLRTKKEYNPIGPDEFFPEERTFGLIPVI